VSVGTVRRRLSTVSGFYAFLHARGDVLANPVPRGLPTRRERSRPRQGVPLVRTTRRLPRVQPVPQTEIFIPAAGFHLADAQLRGHVRGIFHGLTLVRAQEDLERCTLCFYHPPGKSADHIEAFGVNVHQPELIERELVYASQETVDQLGRIGGSASDHCNFEHIIFQLP
jgi:hypothetical protein